MRRRWAAMALLVLVPGPSFAQDGHPVPEGPGEQVQRGLSAEEVQGYLSGEGMGMAKVAELSHYPGPRHVLDLAAEIELPEEQQSRVQEVYDRMHAEAVLLGREIVEKEGALDRAFAGQRVDEAPLKDLVGEIAGLRGELRWVHLGAHLETRRLLSPAQVEGYDALRGYPMR